MLLLFNYLSRNFLTIALLFIVAVVVAVTVVDVVAVVTAVNSSIS